MRFQFHKGTIKTSILYILSFCKCHFNSIKVQLKLNAAKKQLSVTEFQFHKGTIKTLMEHAVSCSLLLFQFHKGTIKTFNGACRVVLFTAISIP